MPLHSQGKIILLVDKTLTNAIETELSGFITNLIGDGWQVLRLNTPRHIDDFSSNTAFLTNYFNMTNIIRPFVQATTRSSGQRSYTSWRSGMCRSRIQARSRMMAIPPSALLAAPTPEHGPAIIFTGIRTGSGLTL